VSLTVWSLTADILRAPEMEIEMTWQYQVRFDLKDAATAESARRDLRHPIFFITGTRARVTGLLRLLPICFRSRRGLQRRGSLQNKNPVITGKKMVGATGIEPVTPTMSR
jgi:hypothetical protein